MSNLEPWQASYCGCLADPLTCLKVCLCFPCSYGCNAERLDGSSCFLYGLGMYCCGICSCLWHPQRRRLLREKYHLAEEPCGDCLASCPCCMGCTTCQEAREMDLRGAPTSASMPNN